MWTDQNLRGNRVAYRVKPYKSLSIVHWYSHFRKNVCYFGVAMDMTEPTITIR